MMDELLRYASLAGAGLPAHERHKAKTATVRRLRGVNVGSGGVLRFDAPRACNERDDLARLSRLTFSVSAGRGDDPALPGVADPDDRAQARPSAGAAPASPGKTRKLVLLAY